ncbi:dipeptide epimerase [Stratiformator vulcanicus]|uniref:Dipeptide epimerase n=1 Tax=Stratiformator vulcanicus TaxID=2527980 RepID=A0A517QWN3_9PLAN|nr:dipeptide epimerase [Stratiformator vulcanicus]QDT36076.1 L-Ala-D/L-Glu epimerase [Stratiformator vulcanicus]
MSDGYELELTPRRMPLSRPFTISRGSIDIQESLLVGLRHREHVGYGEATRHVYYGHSIESLTRSLEAIRPWLRSIATQEPEELWPQLQQKLSDDSFALSAIDSAAHDLAAKIAGTNCFERWGSRWCDVPLSSVTIPIDSPERIAQEAREYAGWPIIKIKLGGPDDLEAVRAVRNATDAIIRVDANCGWDPKQAVELSAELAKLGVEFIEQPLPANAGFEADRFVYQHSKLPVIADESCVREADVGLCQSRFHGVNIKLSKCGGLTPAVRMARAAREVGLSTMVGCMIESSVGVASAAQLLPLIDYADLDGHVLLSDDPTTGFSLKLGLVTLEHPGGHSAAPRFAA